MDNTEIKALIPTSCPSCKTQLIVQFKVTAPSLSGVFTAQMIEEAKQEAIKRINDLGVTEEISTPVIEWINDPDTIFTPDDIDEILKGIDHEPKKEDTEKE